MPGKDEIIRVRAAAEVKARLITGSKRDSMDLSAWLRWLGERRIAEQNGEPVPVYVAPESIEGFVPGFGLNNEEGKDA